MSQLWRWLCQLWLVLRRRRGWVGRVTARRPGAMSPGGNASSHPVPLDPADGGRAVDTAEDERDEGVGTVLVCAVVAALVAVTAIVATLLVVTAARQRAGGAADLAALAAADQVLAGPDAACAAADRLATANGARVVACRVVGQQVWVVTAVPVRWADLDLQATGRARAGPVEPSDG